MTGWFGGPGQETLRVCFRGQFEADPPTPIGQTLQQLISGRRHHAFPFRKKREFHRRGDGQRWRREDDREPPTGEGPIGFDCGRRVRNSLISGSKLCLPA